ncbi:MAG: SDR family NAD(P)-dependent oxidoreductase, partial [Promethearchaeota archaeon]
MKLDKKVALVTGAALGFKNGGPSIGSSIAFRFASEGAKVVVVDILAQMGKRTADRIKADGGEALFIETDVSKTDQVKRAIAITQEEFGMLHCLVNCAASYEGQIYNNVVGISEEDWNNTIDVNL